MRKLIINADDYGLNPLFDKGVLDLVAQGIVTSVSVMILRRRFTGDEVNALKDASPGIHLELKEDSNFKQAERQLEKFEEIFKQKPSHLDGHKHCHLLSGNIENISELAKKYDIPIRSRFKSDRNFFIKKGLRTPSSFISWHPKRIEKLLDALEGQQEDLIEMVCHPGYCDFFSSERYNSRREEELIFLNSEEFQKVVRRFKLVDYSCAWNY